MIVLNRVRTGDRDVTPRRGMDCIPRRPAVVTVRFGRIATWIGILSGLLWSAVAGGTGNAAAAVKAGHLRVTSVSQDTLTLSCELWNPERGSNSDSTVVVWYRFLVSIDGGERLRDPGWRHIGIRRHPARDTVTAVVAGVALAPDRPLRFSILIFDGRRVRTASRRRREPERTASRFHFVAPVSAAPGPAQTWDGMDADYVPKVSWGMLKLLYSDGPHAEDRSSPMLDASGDARLAPVEPRGGARNNEKLPSGRSRRDAR